MATSKKAVFVLGSSQVGLSEGVKTPWCSVNPDWVNKGLDEEEEEGKKKNLSGVSAVPAARLLCRRKLIC